ncbi:exo-beta-N-acetylmuramidase NamZ domain-containing protein [Christiangramia aquimixticola]|uniref:exo-beta-N-acetylmuramidase NamZ family protein n=1 Tax=Christiangramia aquimixticola TaxID=1697558 RepID=UPI003AA7ECA1
MIKRLVKSTFLFFLLGILSCGNTHKETSSPSLKEKSSEKAQDSLKPQVVTGANQMHLYLPKLQGKSVGIVGNQTSVIINKKGGLTHLVDSLLSKNINVAKVFAPEHGFRGTADAGEIIKDGTDPVTSLKVISLYGAQKKPSKETLEGLDIMVFDIQDVGARFYTYISTLHYIMEACAENNIPLLILDRPNPNGHYIDGPTLDMKHSSFVGMHPIPVVHGLTMGEYAKMINGEQWLKDGLQCKLEIIQLENYSHDQAYNLPVKPSPNLPTPTAINLYPSLCFFEGTNVNAGRGTNKQFQIFGSPDLDPEVFKFTYTPQSLPGATSPKHLKKLCYGKDLSSTPYLQKLELKWLIDAYEHTSNQQEFFNSFFTKLAGTEKLQKQIEAGLTEEEIRETWKADLEKFKLKRKPYLLYPEK